MFVYVLAYDDRGPSKIGIAADPKKRLRALQTGSPHALSLRHIEPVGHAAATIERAIHRALAGRRLKGGSEWFDLSPADARIAIRSAAATTGVLFDETATFDSIHQASVFCWIDEQAERRRLKDEDDDDYDEDLPELAPPSPVELIARTLGAPKNQKYNFNDYLRSWEDGVWLRWAFERMGRRQPNGKMLKPYMDADAHMEEHNVKMGRGLYDRWIEWSVGRDLTSYEAETLAQIWDKFIPVHNALESRGDPEPVHGIHDHVDDVHLLTIEGDPRYKDPSYLVFWHEEFRAVVIPERPMKFWSINMGAIEKLYPVDGVRVSGFVAPALPRDIWRRPFLPWLNGASQRRDAALRTFVTNPNKRFPTTEKRERQEGDGLTHVHIGLSCPDEHGWF